MPETTPSKLEMDIAVDLFHRTSRKTLFFVTIELSENAREVRATLRLIVLFRSEGFGFSGLIFFLGGGS